MNFNGQFPERIECRQACPHCEQEHVGESLTDYDSAYADWVNEVKLCRKRRAAAVLEDSRMAANIMSRDRISWPSLTPKADSLARRAGL